jgi:chromosome partitioning protein
VGKTTLAYELAWLLDGVLVDLEWEQGSASRTWGYRWEERLRSPLLAALERGVTPKPLKGHNKPRLVPGHPDFAEQQPTADHMAEALTQWATDWNEPWVVIDTHPGAGPAVNGALAVANVVLAPTPLREKDLEGTAALVSELADYPLVLTPSMVPPIPPAGPIATLREMIAGTPVQVGPPIPRADAVGLRRKRMAITAEQPPAKALQRFATAVTNLSEYIKEYANA